MCCCICGDRLRSLCTYIGIVHNSWSHCPCFSSQTSVRPEGCSRSFGYLIKFGVPVESFNLLFNKSITFWKKKILGGPIALSLNPPLYYEQLITVHKLTVHWCVLIDSIRICLAYVNWQYTLIDCWPIDRTPINSLCVNWKWTDRLILYWFTICW